jgi:parvulin-like peptidyl-prolyl isomerase
MSDVVRTRYGFHVIYLVERIPARHDSVDKVRAEIQMGIFPQYRQQRFEEFITRLLGQHRIEINQYALAALATAAAQGSTASPTAPGQGKDLE